MASEAIESRIAEAISYAHEHHDEALERFKEFLRIPSISTDPAYRAEVSRAADWLVEEMERVGMENCRAIPTAEHPAVYGDWLHAGPDRPTILVYAHYDVQPVDPIELWETPPFDPDVRDGKLFARGVIDDKIGAYANLKAVEAMFATSGSLPVNLKFLFEGAEESASLGMDDFVRDNAEMLEADLLVVSDGGSEPDQPLNMTSLRGIVSAEIVIQGPTHDLHSGLFGGIVHNPLHLAGEIVAALHDAEGRVQIPGFYDDVRPLTPAERAQLDEQEAHMRAFFEEESGIDTFWGPERWTLLERATSQPTCDVNGIGGGYAGDGTKTIIPARAIIKVTLRLVADQDARKIARSFIDFVEGFSRDTLTVRATVDSATGAVSLLSEGPAVEAVARAFEATWGKRPLMLREGGSVPVMSMLHEALAIPMTSLGHGTGSNAHAPNEFLYLEHFGRAIDTAIHFFHYIGETAL